LHCSLVSLEDNQLAVCIYGYKRGGLQDRLNPLKANRSKGFMRVAAHLRLMLFLFLSAWGVRAADVAIPAELRQGTFACDQQTIQTALGIKRAGWVYIMPEPKSPQAAWGHRDGRTTCWVGYWTNSKSKETSATEPKKDAAGKWTGDGNGSRYWRRGGSPPAPTKIEWLCSMSGGIPPQ
jgi:hypothetical protein